MEILRFIRQIILLILAILATIKTCHFRKKNDLKNEIYCAHIANILWAAAMVLW